MSKKLYKSVIIFLFGVWGQANGTIVSPVVQDYGDVFPTLSDVVLNTNRTSDDGPWFVRFNMLTSGDVAMGVKGTNATASGVFTLTSIRITEFDNSSNTIAFGSDTFSSNPFSDPIDQLVLAPALAMGTYALAVSGTGNVNTLFPDFVVHLQVLPPSSVPVPAAFWLFGSGLIGFIGMRKNQLLSSIKK